MNASRTFKPHSLAQPRRLLLTIALLILTQTASAEDLTGTWSASSLRVSWSVGDWGKGCGPRPSGGGEKGGVVQITSTGTMGFQLQGLGRNYSSGTCWEQMAGLSPRGKTLSKSTIQTTCRMPAGDPRQAKVVTTWYPRGEKIYFDETGQYQFVVEGGNCTASVRRTRVLTRVVEKPKTSSGADGNSSKEKSDGDKVVTAAPEPSSSPVRDLKEEAPGLPPSPERASRCSRPGPPTSLEVTPRSKLMRPGEEFQFKAVARDAIGCRVPLATVWSLVSGAGAKLSQDGKLTVAESAQPGRIQLNATTKDKSVSVGALVVDNSEYERLLEGGKYGALGESADAATIDLSSNHVEFDSTQAEPEPSNRLLILGMIAALLGLFGALAVYLLKRRHDAVQIEPAEEQGEEQREGDSAEIEASALAPTPEPPLQPARLCPVCGRRYEDGTQFCVDDGARLMRVN